MMNLPPINSATGSDNKYENTWSKRVSIAQAAFDGLYMQPIIRC